MLRESNPQAQQRLRLRSSRLREPKFLLETLRDTIIDFALCNLLALIVVCFFLIELFGKGASAYRSAIEDS